MLLPEAIYCCFTRTTLFTTMFTVIIVMGSLKSMCIPSSIVMYGLRLFIVVLQELHCLPNCLHISMLKVIGFYHFTKFCLSTPSSF